VRQLAAAFSIFPCPFKRFPFSSIEFQRETGNGQPESGSKLSHSEGARRAQKPRPTFYLFDD
jgi:hypothetical protein